MLVSDYDRPFETGKQKIEKAQSKWSSVAGTNDMTGNTELAHYWKRIGQGPFDHLQYNNDDRSDP